MGERDVQRETIVSCKNSGSHCICLVVTTKRWVVEPTDTTHLCVQQVTLQIITSLFLLLAYIHTHVCIHFYIHKPIHSQRPHIKCKECARVVFFRTLHFVVSVKITTKIHKIKKIKVRHNCIAESVVECKAILSII